MSEGLEVECSVMGHARPVASQPGEIVLTGGADWYDYEAKYEAGGMELRVPAGVPDAVAERVRELAVETFVRSGCSGLARVDTFVEGDRVLINELNTLPGFTETSVFGKLFAASRVPYVELLTQLAGFALERRPKRCQSPGGARRHTPNRSANSPARYPRRSAKRASGSMTSRWSSGGGASSSVSGR